MVFITGHDKEGYPGSCLLHYIHGISEQLLKDIQFFGHANIEAAFGAAAAEAGSLTAGQQKRSDFACFDSFQTCLYVIFFLRLNISNTQCADGIDLTLALRCVIIAETVKHPPVQSIQLFFKIFFLCVIHLIVKGQKMGLVIFFQ